MAGPDPATQPASVSERKDSFALADASALGGRLKGGHDDCCHAFFFPMNLRATRAMKGTKRGRLRRLS
jgi:hypothetical protein